ncbi:MAG: hypothetical protein JSS02_31740, partial [Planctomycetes bacterium]|nr:hypothetical protein [Planctomycetota bacterium]
MASNSKLRFALVCVVLSCCCATGPVGYGQDKPAGPRVEHTSIRSSVGGMHAYVPERWSLISVNVTNPDPNPRELISATYFDAEKTLQYARRFWLPARSRLRTWVPVQIPEVKGKGPQPLNFHSLVMDADRSREELLRDDTGQMLHSGTITTNSESFVSAYIDDPLSLPDVDANAAYDLLVACRRERNHSRRATKLAETLFAPDEFALQPFDQILICSRRAAHDPAGISAIRRWLYNGGKLWVTLNQTDPKILETILGDGF